MQGCRMHGSFPTNPQIPRFALNEQRVFRCYQPLPARHPEERKRRRISRCDDVRIVRAHPEVLSGRAHAPGATAARVSRLPALTRRTASSEFPPSRAGLLEWRRSAAAAPTTPSDPSAQAPRRRISRCDDAEIDSRRDPFALLSAGSSLPTRPPAHAG